MAGARHRPAVERRSDRNAHGRDRGGRAGRIRAQARRTGRTGGRSRVAAPAPIVSGPLRIRGRVGDGLYWSLRAAGASPEVAAQYLAALATEIDVGEVAPNASFDLVLGPAPDLLYAGLNRAGERQLQLVRWSANGRSEWIDAANAANPAPVESGMMMAGEGADHLIFRLPLSPDPALHPFPRGRRYRRELGQPDRRRGRRPGGRARAGQAATVARCRSRMAAG